MKQEIGREDKIIKYSEEQKRAENAALLSLQGWWQGVGMLVEVIFLFLI